jgi:hypothetical protein
VSDQVSHPYKTTGKITFLYISLFIFLDNKLEDKTFYTVELHMTLKKRERERERERERDCMSCKSDSAFRRGEKGSKGQDILVIVRYVTSHPRRNSYPVHTIKAPALDGGQWSAS